MVASLPPIHTTISSFPACVEQCDQIGYFWKGLTINFVLKVAQYLGAFWGFFEKHHLLVENVLATFRASLGKIGLLFLPTSGNTDDECKSLIAAMFLEF